MATHNFNPVDIFFQLEQELLRTAGGAFGAVQFHSSMDMYETESALVIKLELAGIKADTLSITLSADDRYLAIAGERVEPHGESSERLRCYRLEIYYGSFEREITLPSHLRYERDGVTATYREGFLFVTLPKLGEAEPGSRVIRVQTE